MTAAGEPYLRITGVTKRFGEIVALRDAGKAILLVSVELDEIMSLSDRIAVMFDGQIMGMRDPATTDERELGMLMAGMTGKGADTHSGLNTKEAI